MVSNAVNGLSSASYDGRNAIAASEHAIYAQSTMMTLALGINVSVMHGTTSSEPYLSELAATVCDRGRNSLVARMRHLATQSHHLHWRGATHFDNE